VTTSTDVREVERIRKLQRLATEQMIPFAVEKQWVQGIQELKQCALSLDVEIRAPVGEVKWVGERINSLSLEAISLLAQHTHQE
jgi:hypothetical protein